MRSNYLLLLCLFLAGCRTTPQSVDAPIPANSSPPPASSPAGAAAAAAPTPTATPEPPTATPAPQAALCSPLEGYSLAQLRELVSNPYHPPPPGSDDPHQGVDLADRLPASQIALAGRPVQAVLPGRVVAVVADRFPYGSALMIESPLDELPASLLARLDLPAGSPAPVTPLALSCPPFEAPTAWDFERPSLYLLYAHLQQPPAFQPEDEIDCGQQLGAVGDSGNALNPHLHFEVRLGPAGARLGSMAHYDPGATPAEMGAYCTWRVSGFFQLVDPLRLLEVDTLP